MTKQDEEALVYYIWQIGCQDSNEFYKWIGYASNSPEWKRPLESGKKA